MQIQWTNKLSASDGIKHVNYGPSGIGKTRLIATATRPFIFNAEKGLLSLRKFNLPYVTISSLKDLSDAYNWAMKSNETRNYDLFALDSISEIAEVYLKDELDQSKDARKAYGNMQQGMYEIIRNFRDLKQKHVYFCAKQMFIVEGSGLESYRVATPIMPSEKLQAQLPYFFDLVTHHGMEQTYEVLHCKTTKYFHAKDRSGNLNSIEEPNLAKLYAKCLK